MTGRDGDLDDLLAYVERTRACLDQLERRVAGLVEMTGVAYRAGRASAVGAYQPAPPRAKRGRAPLQMVEGDPDALAGRMLDETARDTARRMSAGMSRERRVALLRAVR